MSDSANPAGLHLNTLGRATSSHEKDVMYEEESWAASYNKPTGEVPWVNPYALANPEELITAEDLPFIRYKLPPEEEEPESVRTVSAWVVEVPDQKMITTLLKWLKKTDLDTPELAHLKRIRKQNGTATFLLASQTAFPLDPPSPPHDLNLPVPYLQAVPASSASTPTQLTLKTALWPTMYTPRRKDEQEMWSRGKAAWAWHSMKNTIQAAVEAHHSGELPIAALIPVPYEEARYMENHVSDLSSAGSKDFLAHDTRKSSNHPLRHAIMNAIRAVADSRALVSTPPSQRVDQSVPILLESNSDGNAENGSNYLLTSLTLFTTHEPCVMCSMALLHSRVKEVIFLYPMPHTGACGSITCLPILKGVNHRYSIGQWKWNKDDGNAVWRAATQSNIVRTEGLCNAEIDSVLDIGTTVDA